jgi:hypothetical protein
VRSCSDGSAACRSIAGEYSRYVAGRQNC